MPSPHENSEKNTNSDRSYDSNNSDSAETYKELMKMVKITTSNARKSRNKRKDCKNLRLYPPGENLSTKEKLEMRQFDQYFCVDIAKDPYIKLEAEFENLDEKRDNKDLFPNNYCKKKVSNSSDLENTSKSNILNLLTPEDNHSTNISPQLNLNPENFTSTAFSSAGLNTYPLQMQHNSLQFQRDPNFLNDKNIFLSGIPDLTPNIFQNEIYHPNIPFNPQLSHNSYDSTADSKKINPPEFLKKNPYFPHISAQTETDDQNLVSNPQFTQNTFETPDDQRVIPSILNFFDDKTEQRYDTQPNFDLTHGSIENMVKMKSTDQMSFNHNIESSFHDVANIGSFECFEDNNGDNDEECLNLDGSSEVDDFIKRCSDDNS